MITFKQYLQEASLVHRDSLHDSAMKAAADFLETTPDNLAEVDDHTAAKVLDTGKEMERKIIKAASGSIIIRAFKTISQMFARIEAPNGDNVMYKKEEKKEQKKEDREAQIRKLKDLEIDLSW